MEHQKINLKHTDYYLCSENNASIPFSAVLNDSEFLEITSCCFEVEVKKDFEFVTLLGLYLCYAQV